MTTSIRSLRIGATIIFILTGILIITGSCSKKIENRSRDQARQLFLKSIKVNESYIDSILKAPDSLTLTGLINRYKDAVTSLNFNFPAGTDYELSEGENDTLKHLNDRIIFLRDSLYYAYACPVHNDTIPLDSI